MTISVVIPTKNRPCDLRATIKTLLKQACLPAELIIVDQSSDQAFLEDLPIPTKYVHNPHFSGLTAARNAAMHVATGDIWLFLDDDVELEPAFIQEILNAYGPDVTGVSGIITNYEKPPLPQQLWETVFLRGPFRDDRQRVYRNASRLQDSKPVRMRRLTGALMSFRASAIRGIWFDETLTGACPGEDIEFCARLPKASLLLIAPKARLVHKRSPEARDPTHWLALHAQVSQYMCLRHWRTGALNHLCFAWLNVGYAVVAAIGCLKRRSLGPWRAWREGARRGIQLAQTPSQRGSLLC